MAAVAASGGLAGGVPSQAEVVVVGGGVIGTSITYHLAKRGVDVVLLEQGSLTAGTTWHAAGLMATFGSLSETSTELRKYSKHLYADVLEAETGLATGFDPVGFVELATAPDRVEEYRRVAAFNRKCGIDVQEISAADVAELFPLCAVDDVYAGFYVPTDGRVNPTDVTMALAKGARLAGATIHEGVAVDHVAVVGRRVTGVVTADGSHIACDKVVNATGMWARQFGAAAGVNIPNQAAEHYYLITDDLPELDRKCPVIEDPENYCYIRPEGEGLMIGLFEGEAAAWAVDGIPRDFTFGEIEPDWERMTPYLERAMARVPASLNVGVKKFFCGPESFTPDLAPLVGPAPELDGYWVAAGLNSIGIITGGGLGHLVAEWMTEGYSSYDVTGINVDRLHPYQATPAYRAARVVESLGLVYKTHYPTRPSSSARGVKRSPLHAALADRGACFRDVSGWEGADWYAPQDGSKWTGELSPEPLTWGRHHWFANWAAEHHACRNGVVAMDMSFMSKFRVQGRDAGAQLNRLSTANVDGAPGEITYTQWLNDRGKLEADLTVTKVTDDDFMVVATDTMHRHVLGWMHKMFEPEAHAIVTDVTGGLAQINVQGPDSRALMTDLTGCDFSNVAFPFRAVREMPIGFALATVARITYLGELGYELYVPAEHAMHVYEQLVEVGARHGLVHAGLKALSSLRMEKGYRDYGHDMDNTDSLLEVGLGFTADLNKSDGFIGRDELLAQKAIKGMPPRRLLQILVDDPEPMMYHGEVVYRNGKVVGDIRAASYGHTLGGAVGLSMIEADEPINLRYINDAEWEVDIAGIRYPAQASSRPLYDPKNERIKAED
ncbi:glycine cleavage T-protein [Thecamonas trahens ATCC 50062]|uniref:Glycine cleavage T-protein n=1 Tax=Thecamonas trahens ATCC 50062 TaxID=461836 RepID=A0A0L0D5W9_THETB|nr:glycine cleavage T-protein [Thecamonas trahens ATCC 50062]KNC47481.1 glycine cleavage T-protein [Thecamonas trahens ATCC 50062]|eukprot:XP_013759417.1 glycine cleavage T-protein [Thecamonas trahens ATCC 50062]